MKIVLAATAIVAFAMPVLAQTATAPAAAEAPRPGTTMTPMPPGVRGLKNQTGEQAQLDVAQCQNAASQATGYVPGTAPAAPAQTAPPVGGRAKGAAKGAAAGAVVGAVDANNHPYAPESVKDDRVGDAAGAGAAAGAVAGGMNQRQDRRKGKAQQQQAASAQQQKATAWQNNYAGCLQSRGYALDQVPATAPAA
ncbi:MAG: hypothetical protein ACOYLS_15090 [Polymorphobacter sp.]